MKRWSLMRRDAPLVATICLVLICGAWSVSAKQATPMAQPGATAQLATPIATPMGNRLVEPTTLPAVGPAGPGISFLPDGVPGQLTVVATGPLPTRQMTTHLVMVRNLTGSTVGVISVSATARDAAGSLVSVGQSILPMPYTVAEGGLAFVRMFFDPPELPLDAVVDYTVTSGSLLPEGVPPTVPDLVVNEVSFLPDQVLGTVTNNGTVQSYGSSVVIFCVGTDGGITAVGLGRVEPGILPVGLNGTFSVPLTAQCDQYVIAAGG